jgi:hypothetical protein
MRAWSEIIITLPPSTAPAPLTASETVARGAPKTFSDTVVDNDEPAESRTRTLKEKAPGTKGIPEIVPAEDLKVRPGAICPVVAPQE